MLAVDDHTVVDSGDMPPVLRRAARRLPPAGPGRRTDSAGSDGSVTSRIERLPDEVTPAPLPPSPAAQDADVWFEQVPTNPASVIPDLGNPRTGGTGGGIGPIAATNPIRRYGGSGTGAFLSSLYRDGQAGTGVRPPWTLPLLIAATCLAVGMVFGALLFGGGGSAPAMLHAHDAGECVCPEPPEP